MSNPFFCRHCGSQFIATDKAECTKHEPSQLHFQKLVVESKKHAEKKKNEDGGEGEETKKEDEIVSPLFWKIPDVWDFDNIGQTRVMGSPTTETNNNAEVVVGGGFVPGETVYVVCADCEREPVGIRWRANESYYVSHSRVVYEKPESAPENGALPPGMSEEYIRGLIAQQQAAADLAK
mmetsp:Transcript_11519/g.16122  ORF Transcript_11519/g.16122 Transcript_11519/m.16122 type:complete len:179 (+) Transcript_11519:63-599(+)